MPKMRNPNGYGSVVKLSGNRRRPYVARKTVGFNDKGHPIYEPIGYYKDRKEAVYALAAYNTNPYDIAGQKTTFAEVYERWTKHKYTNKGKPVTRGYVAAYKACKGLHGMAFPDIRTDHMQKELDTWDVGYSSKQNMRLLFGLLFKFAMQNDIVEKNYADFLVLEEPEDEVDQKHKPFTAEELAILWEHSTDKAAQIALIYCYSGLRPSELLKIKTANVFLSERYMIGGIKTKSSKNREIPIAEKIYKFIESMYNPDNEYLFTDFDGPVTYPRLNWRYWNPLMQILGMDHLPHDGRHTCATMLDNAAVNKTIIKKILGHAGKDVTEKVYTHKAIRQLIDAINLI